MTSTASGNERLRIFDTTLRDGEQAPGCSMSVPEKLAVAGQLARLGVDIIEAGFPAASDGEREAVAEIAARVGTSDGPVICGLARATSGDVETCGRAIEPAKRRRVHTFIATSDLHLAHKLRMTRPQVLAQLDRAIRDARCFTDDVEFSPEDGSRTDPTFLDEVLLAAVEAGATTLNVPDTVGFSTPDEYAAIIHRACGVASTAPGVVVSAHCHDDLGMAVANSLAAIRAGARQVECTINGIGERAGNAALEEIVMAVHTRPEVYGVTTGIDTREIGRTSRLVATCTGIELPPNKAVVGANAFAHESGIHQDGMLKHRATYEIMTPEAVGAAGTSLVLGKHSGRNALSARLRALGYELSDSDVTTLFHQFKELTDRKKTVDDIDLLSLVADRHANAERRAS